MSPEPTKDEPERQIQPTPAPAVTEQRRLYRPETPTEPRRTIFSDWASI